jgi:uncharacterized protein YecE (DUF72 family)
MKKSAPNASQTQGLVRIGPAGWSYPDWNGYVYPTRRPKGFHEASFLADYFDTIEINTSFYQPLRPDHAALWVERVSNNQRFQFTAKLWQRFTHEPGGTKDDEIAVRAGFDALRKAERLGAVLLQFPFSFHATSDSQDHLAKVLARFSDYPLAVELRHGSWQTTETLDLFRKHDVAFCNIDQPIIGHSLQPSAEVTSRLGYARLHGRRYDTWFDDNPETSSHQRYNYLYSLKELDPWASRIRSIEDRADNTYVITNNHYLGKAAVNALQLISILKRTRVKVPEPLRRHYPELEKIADEMPAEPMLFPMGIPPGKK